MEAWSKNGPGYVVNGLIALALALFAKHALGQDLVYTIFAAIGGVLVAVGVFRIFILHDYDL